MQPSPSSAHCSNKWSGLSFDCMLFNTYLVIVKKRSSRDLLPSDFDKKLLILVPDAIMREVSAAWMTVVVGLLVVTLLNVFLKCPPNLSFDFINRIAHTVIWKMYCILCLFQKLDRNCISNRIFVMVMVLTNQVRPSQIFLIETTKIFTGCDLNEEYVVT